MSEPADEGIALFYDDVYTRLRTDPAFQAILSKALDEDALHEPGQFSFAGKAALAHVTRAAGRCLAPFDAIDLGCGTGWLTCRLSRLYPGRWTGIDLSAVAIGQAHELCPGPGTSFFCMDMMQLAAHLPADRLPVSLVVAVDSIQHASCYQTMAGVLRQILLAGGQLVFTNWMRQQSPQWLIRHDPLISALASEGFTFASIDNLRHDFDRQLLAYRLMYDKRAELERALSRSFLTAMMNEAAHLVARQHRISRFAVTAVAPGPR